MGFLLSFLLFAIFIESVAPSAVNFFSSPSDQVFMGNLIVEIQNDFYGNFWLGLFILLLGSGVISFFTVERFLRKRHLLADG
jgi:hypothetical protein